MRTTSRHSSRRRHHGQAMVEFGFVLPIATLIIFGIVTSAWLFYQSSALGDGISGGSRMAAIIAQTNIAAPTGPAPNSSTGEGLDQAFAKGGASIFPNCNALGLTGLGEYGYPDTIVHSMQQAAPQVAINPGQLCVVAGATPPYKMRQKVIDPNRANVTVLACPISGVGAKGLDGPKELQVTVTMNANGLAPPFRGTIVLKSTSTVPVPDTSGLITPCAPGTFPPGWIS